VLLNGKAAAAGSPPAPRPGARLTSIDVLRGLSALAVMASHIPHSIGNEELGLLDVRRLGQLAVFPLSFGWMGVPAFIVLSGFCIHVTCARRAASGGGLRANWGGFWKRRFARLYPPYLAAIVLSVAIYVALDQALPGRYAGWTRDFLPDLLSHLFMFHNLLTNYHYGLGNGPLWSLGMEEQLYALYAVFLVTRRRWNVSGVLLGVLAISFAWVVFYRATQAFPESFGWAAPNGPFTWGEFPFRWWLAWILGAVAAEAYVGLYRLPAWCYDRRLGAVLFVLALFTCETMVQFVSATRAFKATPILGDNASLVWMITPVSDLALPLAVFVLVNQWVTREAGGGFRSRWIQPLALVGLISYSLYLFHVPLIAVLEAVFPFGESLGGVALRFLVFGPICIVAAGLIFLAAERPAMLLAHGLSKAGKPSRGQPVVVLSGAALQATPAEEAV
jgi:peptidoglycan/LPS O-acetylase OafA/YrhL